MVTVFLSPTELYRVQTKDSAKASSRDGDLGIRSRCNGNYGNYKFLDAETDNQTKVLQITIKTLVGYLPRKVRSPFVVFQVGQTFLVLDTWRVNVDWRLTLQAT